MTIYNELFTLDDIINLAHETIEKNKETFIAQYILQNPNVNLKDVVLCYKPDCNGNIEFYIEEKKL